MIILASDTSLECASVALLEDKKIIKEIIVNNNKKHAENFMPLVKELFNEIDYEISDVDVFTVSSGPGSFTGLRIGIASIKSMAYILKKDMIMVPTLDILAKQSEISNAIMCPMINARNNQVYTALYSKDKLTEYLGIKIEDLVDMLKEYDSDIILSGDCVSMHLEYIKANIKNNIFYNEENEFPKASVCGLICGDYDKIKAENAIPFYLRPSQAERLFDKK